MGREKESVPFENPVASQPVALQAARLSGVGSGLK
jgi:hypothetical protein